MPSKLKTQDRLENPLVRSRAKTTTHPKVVVFMSDFTVEGQICRMRLLITGLPVFDRTKLAGGQMQKAVTPEEGGVFVDATSASCRARTHPVNQCLAVGQPLLMLAQMGQGRASQSITGAAAIMTAVARQTMVTAARM